MSDTRDYWSSEMDREMSIGFSKRESIAERLERHPALKARMERMLDVVENAAGDVRRADDAERRAIEELRQMGLEVMQAWGQKTANEAALELEAMGEVVREVKKTPLDLHVRRSDGASGPQDRRKTRKLFWKEAKLSMIRRADEVTPRFAVTLGDAAAAGADLMRLALAAGFNQRSHVHGLGDGAPWIADQMERQFGAQFRYHIDFFHVCDYLAAAKACAANDPGWMDRQKDRLKTNQLPAVLSALAPFLEPDTVPSEDAPVRGYYRYLTNRLRQFEYHAAIQADLPIGSGEVESAHRYVIQKRLKLSGAWWTPENAQAMLNLRVTRTNGGWNRYWDNLAA
jgi:hypothetical protein